MAPQQLHLAHAALSLLLAVWAAIRFRRDRGNSPHLVFWAWACGTWFVYYLLKSRGIIPGGGSKDAYTWLSLMLDAQLSNINSVFIYFTSVALKDRQCTRAGRVSFFLAVAILLQFLMTYLVSREGISLEESVFKFSWVSGMLSGFMLILVYHQWANHIETKRRTLRAMSVWVFGGYALLQREYPTMLASGSQLIPTEFVYAIAFFLKIACTAFLFGARVTKSLGYQPAPA